MAIFTNKPVYTQEAINQQVTNLERLNKLRDMCLQKLVLQGNNPIWQRNAEGYSRNIDTGQRYLDHMHDKNVGRKKSPPVREG